MWQTCEKMTDYCSGRPWGMERRKVGVESWSPPVDVCGILRRSAVSSASNNNSSDQSSCQMELSVRPSVRRKQMQPASHPPSRCTTRHLQTSSHSPPLTHTPLASCASADRRRHWEDPARDPARPPLVNCFNREKETHAPSCRLPHTDRQTDGRTDGRKTEWDRYTQLVPRYTQKRLKTRVD